MGGSARAFGVPLAGPGHGRRAALRAAEAALSRYFEESLELLWSADQTGRLVRVNPAWKRCLGHPAEAMPGRSLTDFIHEQDRDPAAPKFLPLAHGSRDSNTARSGIQTPLDLSTRLEHTAPHPPLHR